MDMIEFSNSILAEKISIIFKDFFENHICAYKVLKGIKFVRINDISFDKASITYSVKLLDDEDKDLLLSHLQGITVNIYGKDYSPDVYLNGDILCITIDK